MDKLYQLTSKKKENRIVFIKELFNKVIHKIKYKKFIPYNKEIYIVEDKVIYKDKNQIKIKPKIIKKRNSGIDLIRILAMLGIIYTHILFQGKGIYKYRKYNLIKTHCFVCWHNNAFSLISGIVGYKSTKYTNLLYLWLCVVFYSVGIRYYYLKFKPGSNINGELYQECFPVIYKRYWYFSSYFGLFIFLPAVNKGLQYLSKPEFKLLVISIFYIFAFWFNYINNKIDVFFINRGYSTIWLLCLYIFGVYLGKFNLIFIGIKRYIFSLIYLFMFLSLCSLYYKYRDYTTSNINGNYKKNFINFIKKLMPDNLNNVLKTSQAILITLFFLQLKYNEYLSKIITFFGPLTFGVYLIHINANVYQNYLKEILIKEPDNLISREVIKMFIFKTVKLFFLCIVIEYLRHLLFTILKIRKICQYIEKIAFKIVS